MTGCEALIMKQRLSVRYEAAWGQD